MCFSNAKADNWAGALTVAQLPGAARWWYAGKPESLPAAPIELITNGGFETGTFAGWTGNSTGGYENDFYAIANRYDVPASGRPTAPYPTGGNFIAVSDQ